MIGSTSFVALGACLALGHHKGDAELTPDFLVRGLGDLGRAALQVGAGQVMQGFEKMRHAGLGKPCWNAKSRHEVGFLLPGYLRAELSANFSASRSGAGSGCCHKFRV